MSFLDSSHGASTTTTTATATTGAAARAAEAVWAAATGEVRQLVARYPSKMASDTYIIRVLLILSVTFASVSVLATLTTLYWFVRMRRSFRHE